MIERESQLQKSPYWVRNSTDDKTWFFLFLAVINMIFRNHKLYSIWKQCHVYVLDLKVLNACVVSKIDVEMLHASLACIFKHFFSI